jgi:hypothetical protein
MTPDGLWRDAANLFEERIFAHVRRRIAAVAAEEERLHHQHQP